MIKQFLKLKILFQYLSNINLKSRLFLALMLVIFLIINYQFVMSPRHSGAASPSKIIGLITVNLIFLLLCIIITGYKILSYSFNEKPNTSFLQKRIIIAFSLVAAIPTIVVATFSAYIFNFAMQPWFDQKISRILDESTIVAQSYIEDQTLQLKETALSIADDFSNMYYDLINNPHLFAEVLNGQAEMRSLNEAIIFQSSTNTILAQTPLSFSLSFATIPKYLLQMADSGKLIQVKSEPTKIRMLIKLSDYSDTYLLIGRLINSKIIDHIDVTKGAAKEYYKLKKDIISIQIKFSIIFILVALLLLFIAIIWGIVIASQIVKPIKNLVIATEKAKGGDLTVQVSEDNLAEDEVMILTKGFNHMIRQIYRQQRDLIIAQRAMAWSDVARRVAHEIKNPLTPIQLASERLLNKFESEVSDKQTFNKYISIIVRHTQDIEKIVVEFVNFARLPLPTFLWYELVSLLNEIVTARKLINDKISYNFNTNKQVINFIGDAAQMRQVILNLLKNAEEALESLEVQPVIDISIVQEDEIITIILEDNGLGFPAHLLEQATEAYVSSRSKGMGLGLAIVKKIVQDHLGVIEIYNQDKGGARIKLVFNLTELKNKLK